MPKDQELVLSMEFLGSIVKEVERLEIDPMHNNTIICLISLVLIDAKENFVDSKP